MRSRSADLRAVAGALALMLGACDAPPTSAATGDAGQESAPSFELTVGTGRDAFEELDAEGTLVLERGTQGLQHVYVSLRAPIPEGLHMIDVSLVRGDRALSAPTRISAPFLAIPGEDLAELAGQLVVVLEPDGATDGTPSTLRARVEPLGGGHGEAEREVRLRW